MSKCDHNWRQLTIAVGQHFWCDLCGAMKYINRDGEETVTTPLSMLQIVREEGEGE